jgi:hypothetical protein
MNHLGMEELGSVGWSKLKKLYLSDNKDIGKQGIVFLTPARFPLLATLTLDGINLGPQGLKELMSHQWKNLKSLSVGTFPSIQATTSCATRAFSNCITAEAWKYSFSVLFLACRGQQHHDCRSSRIRTAGRMGGTATAETGYLPPDLGSNQIKKEGHVELINRLTKLYYISISNPTVTQTADSTPTISAS